jgi:hypothetical protein
MGRPIIDLVGQKFGKLTVISLNKKENGIIFWDCKCDCGNETVVRGGCLTQGKSNSCGCSHISISVGDKFGMLTVLKLDHRKLTTTGSDIYWLCKCNCGNETVVCARNLKKGNTKSCGCLVKEQSSINGKLNVVDLTGKRFGKLTVVKRVDKPEKLKSAFSFWLCECECGNSKIMSSNDLKKGEHNSKSCGCYSKRGNPQNLKEWVSQHLKDTFTDLNGERFGILTVVEQVPSPKNNEAIYWKCLCDCGKEIICLGHRLRSGNKKSCGCLFKKPWGVASFNYLLRQYKRDAERRCHTFELTEDEFFTLTQGDCFYCGKAPSQVMKHKGNNGDYIYNGIDRINSSIGYTIDNCVSCCVQCNKGKMSLSQTEFYSLIDRIHGHFHNTENKSMCISVLED